MPDNGSGVFTRLYSWVADAAAAVAISPTEFDNDGIDVAGALSNRLCLDGQSTVKADIPWNNKKITGLKAGTLQTDAVNLSQLYGLDDTASTPFNCTIFSNSGSLNTYTVSSFYKKIGRFIITTTFITIADPGTGGSWITMSLPYQSANRWSLHGSNATTGKALSASIQPGFFAASILMYDGSTPCIAGANLIVNGIYETVTP